MNGIQRPPPPAAIVVRAIGRQTRKELKETIGCNKLDWWTESQAMSQLKYSITVSQS